MYVLANKMMRLVDDIIHVLFDYSDYTLNVAPLLQFAVSAKGKLNV